MSEQPEARSKSDAQVASGESALTPLVPAAPGGGGIGGHDLRDPPAPAAPRRLSRWGEAALEYFALGLCVIPFVTGTKRPAVKLEAWRAGLSTAQISAHWGRHPIHDVACVVGTDLLVLDADTPAALAALQELERAHGVEPRLVVGTPRGEHHYLRLAPGTHARSDSHSSAAFPDRIDVRTGNAFAKLPPGAGREVIRCDIATVADLGEVGQAFVDALYRHNGRQPPRPRIASPQPDEATPPSSTRLRQVAALLDAIDPDCGYADWLAALMAVHHESGGGDEDLELAVQWSSRGHKFKGRAELEAKWRSFKLDVASPHTLGTLFYLARKCGADPMEILDAAEPGFEPCA